MLAFEATVAAGFSGHFDYMIEIPWDLPCEARGCCIDSFGCGAQMDCYVQDTCQVLAQRVSDAATLDIVE
jgi:hypothetical protein